MTAETARPALIDGNVTLSRWPFRRLPDDDTAKLCARLRKAGVVEAWAGSFEGLFHRDLAGANRRLAEECRGPGKGLLRPFGSVNPTLPDWEEDLRRCHEELRMPGIRLHPNYHGYKADHPAFGQLLAGAADRGLVVQVALCMEDERTQNQVFRVPQVDPLPLLKAVKALPKLRLVLIDCFRNMTIVQAAALASAGQVFFDLAMLEGTNGLSNLVEKVDPKRVLFGSHAPLFVLESALFKLREVDLPAPILQRIRAENARHLLADTSPKR
jgi:predicted TIM-barrel fold metal-dependent hydrolase